MNKKILMPFITSAFVLPLTFSCNNNDKTCKIILNHYRDYVYNNTNTDEYASKPINLIKDELKKETVNGMETYKFIGLDYDTDYSRSSWPAASHLSKTLKIALVAEYRNSNELRDIAKKLTYHWVFSNYHNINWWQNELGANNTLANVGLFTFDYLDKKGQDAFNGKIRESSLKYRPSVSTHTGANVFDYIDITCRNAAINNDKEEMDIAFSRLEKEINNTGIEGFQKDGSFFQHGRQVQNVSYGKSIIRVARTLYQLRNTNYHMNDEKMKILSDYVSKGIGQSTFKGYTNYTTVSREYSRVNNLDTQANGFNDLAYLIGVDNYPEKEKTFYIVDSLRNRKNATKEPTITYFPIAKMIVANIGQDLENNKEGIYISYKGTAPYLTNTECVNGENQLGLNLSYGTNTCVMDKGTEYFNISPIMDYNYMPGTTSVMYTDSEHVKSDDQVIKEYATLYGDQLYGQQVPEATENNGYIYNDGQNDDVTFLMTRTMHHERSKYTVTCFTSKDGMVLVGSDFTYTPKDPTQEKISRDMHTTIDQYITKDEAKEEKDLTSTRNHSDGNVKYTMLDDNKFTKSITKKDYDGESWKRNNRDIKTTDSGSKNVARITIDGNASSYAYAIEPYNEDKSSKFTLEYNENNIHAIRLPNGKIVAAFYNKDNLKFVDKNGNEHELPSSEFITGKGGFKVF